jgi:class 3 adenylate cyclase/tetratricopeptide (TPR) repeat protein
VPISTDREESTVPTGQSCSRCGFDSPAGMAFCGSCGAPHDRPCSVCGTRNPPRFRFCGGCGAPLETVVHGAVGGVEVEPEAERRQLTVMFCDLVGSTRLSLDLDPEELRELLRGYQAACARAIERFDGHIAQYLGDGVLVYFGYPVALENEAERAVRAGLSVAEEVHRLGAKWRHRTGETLAVRIGIHTGLVVVGEVGSGAKRENLALGGTPNIAARLQSIAEPNTVVISAVTHRLVSRSFATTDLGPRTLRGVSGIGAIYRVDGIQDEVRSGRRTELVGRERELAALAEMWDDVRDGRGRTVILVGDAGIGKSHLVDGFLDTLADVSHIVIECRCLPYYHNTALHPFVDRLESEIGLRAGKSPEQALHSLEKLLERDGLPVREAMPAFAALLGLPYEMPDPAPSPEAFKDRIHAWLLQLLLHTAETCPVVFLVEDVHWADPSTIELITRFRSRIDATRVLALFTARTGFRSEWSEHGDVVRVDLGRLSAADTERIVHGVAGKPLPAEVLRQIVMRTDGVPLFVEELSKTVLQTGLLVERPDRYVLEGPLPPLAIPATLQDSLEARLDRLAAVKEIAQLGATLGREFAYDLLHAVSGIDEQTLHHGLQRLVDAELILEVESGDSPAYAFRHALLQEAAYQSLLRSTRQRYHARIAEVLVREFPELTQSEPETVALHYAAAGLPHLSAPRWLEAGKRAMRAWANQEAVSHLRNGLAQLELMEPSVDRAGLELELQATLGPALIATEGYTSAAVRSAYERALAICQDSGEVERLATIVVGLFAYHIVRLDLNEAGALADELTELAGRTGSEEMQLLADGAKGSVLLNLGALKQAEHYFERAITAYDPQRHSSLLLSFGHDVGVVSHSYLGAVHWFAGFPIRSRRSGEAAVELARSVGHPHSLAFALAFHGAQNLWRREWDVILDIANELLALSTEWRFRHWQADALTLQACVLAEHDKADAALERLHHAASLFQDRGTGADPQYDLRMALVYNLIGRQENALHILEQVVGEDWGTRAFRWRSEFCLLLAHVLQTIDGRESEAEVWLRRSVEDAHGLGARSPELRAATSLARLLGRRGNVDEAIGLLRPVYETFTEGHDLPDLREAADLMASLGHSLP